MLDNVLAEKKLVWQKGKKMWEYRPKTGNHATLSKIIENHYKYSDSKLFMYFIFLMKEGRVGGLGDQEKGLQFIGSFKH